MNKKIKYLSACLLSLFMMTSSFGCTFVVHSCSISGNSTISINNIDIKTACGGCCDDNSNNHKSAVESKCCTEMSYCNYFPTEANQSVQSSDISKLSLFNVVNSASPSSFSTIFFTDKNLANCSSLAHLKKTPSSLLNKICKLQI